MNQFGCQDGAAIRRLREDQNLSALALAERVGIKRRSLYNIELGNKPAGLAVLVRIARALGVPVDKVLKAEDETGTEAEDVAAALWPAPQPAA